MLAAVGMSVRSARQASSATQAQSRPFLRGSRSTVESQPAKASHHRGFSSRREAARTISAPAGLTSGSERRCVAHEQRAGQVRGHDVGRRDAAGSSDPAGASIDAAAPLRAMFSRGVVERVGIVVDARHVRRRRASAATIASTPDPVPMSSTARRSVEPLQQHAGRAASSRGGRCRSRVDGSMMMTPRSPAIGRQVPRRRDDEAGRPGSPADRPASGAPSLRRRRRSAISSRTPASVDARARARRRVARPARAEVHGPRRGSATSSSWIATRS